MATLRRLIRNPLAVAGLAVVAAYLLIALLAPWIAPHGIEDFSLSSRLKPPSGFDGSKEGYLLGTDTLGRDLLSRVIYGARVSMTIGFVSVALSAAIGTALGAAAGYFGGWLDQTLSRLADLLMAFPYLLFTILMMGVLGPGFFNLILALSFKAWVEFFRLARGEMLTEKRKEYVEAALSIGRADIGVITREILPNIMHTMLVLTTLRLGYMIIMEASLSFLGLGVPPDVPAWGSMVASGRSQLMEAWWVSTVPGLVILVLVLAINALGEGLRDAADPRLRGR